jgi:hypothetical protein
VRKYEDQESALNIPEAVSSNLGYLVLIATGRPAGFGLAGPCIVTSWPRSIKLPGRPILARMETAAIFSNHQANTRNPGAAYADLIGWSEETFVSEHKTETPPSVFKI